MKSLILLLLAVPALAQELNTPEPPPPPPHYQVQQGHVVVIPLDPQQCSGQAIEGLGRTWRCGPDGRLLVAAAYNDPAAQYDVTTRFGEESLVLAIVSVVKVAYDRDDKSARGRPGPASKRRKAEKVLIAQALTAGERDYPELPLTTPWVAPLDRMELSGDPFGLYRDWTVRKGKGKKRKVIDAWTTRHEGIDQRAKTGTAVYAAGAGAVVHASRTSTEGNMVIVYHGSGVYTLSLHLSRIKVKVGALVTAGQLLGAAGATGAANGAHLHYTIKVNGAHVDPEAFIETLNEQW